MFAHTSTDRYPWIVAQGNEKKRARLESIRHVLSTVDYPGRGASGVRLEPDESVVARAPTSSSGSVADDDDSRNR